MTDVPRELEDLRSRMRVLEGGYRRSDRQTQLQRLGQGPDPRSLSLGERQDANLGSASGFSRMGLSSGYNTLGGAQPWHGQANLLLDPTFETITDTTVLGGSPGVDGEWQAYYVVNSGTAPARADMYVAFARTDANNNPFNSALLVIQFGWAAGDVSDTDVYLYPVTDFTPTSIPTLPYLTASVRFANRWSYLQTIDNVELSMQLVDGTGTVIAESSPQLLAHAEQWQAWTSAAYESGINDWLWRLRIHLVKEVTPLDAELNIGIGEPQLSFTYTQDPVPFQPALGAWSLDTGHMTGQTRLTGVISPTLTGNVNDWNPAGLSGASVIRIFPNAPGWGITGLAAQPAGTLLLVLNAVDGTSINLVGESLSSASSPENRFVGNLVIDGSFTTGTLLWYDGLSARWRLVY